MPEIEIIDLNFQGLEQSIACYLIRTDDGPILIETGPHSTYSTLNTAIQNKGIGISDIKHVFLTHIHLDHAGAAWALANNGANIYLHPFGAKNMQDPSRLMASAKLIYQDQMDTLWGEMNPIPGDQLIQVDHEETVTIGNISIKSLHTPGHAKHHIAWQIGDIVFAGDVAGVKIGSGPIQPPCPPPDINIEQWKESLEIIRNVNPRLVYLTHYDSVENIDEHFEELNYVLDDWAEYVKEKWQQGYKNEEIVPFFMKHTENQLIKAGLPKKEIARYQAANPSWMSVAGLVRYWLKKSQN